MVYSFKTVAAVKRTAHVGILSGVALACVACGVRGPLTVNPKPIKGLDGVAAAAPSDLRAAPDSAVLYGSNGKQTIIVAPAATSNSTPVGSPK
jgi:hypothetical protein